MWDAFAAFLGALLAVAVTLEAARAEPPLLLEEGLEVVTLKSGARVVVRTLDAGQ